MQELSASLEALYTSSCGHNHFPDLGNLVDNDALTQQMLAATQQMWKDRGMPEGLIDENVTRSIAQTLWQAVEQGYGLKMSDVAFNSTDYEILSSLQKQTWQFAGAKNYRDLRTIGDELIGPDGQLRSKADFIRAASKHIDQSLKQFLPTEYNLAVQGAIHTAKWKDIERDNELFPFIEWDAVLDQQTTSICKPLEGLVLRWDDPRVDRIYPPNHWNCRTTVRRKAYGPTGSVTVPPVDIKPMFQVNLGKQRLAFPPDHPYFINSPLPVINKALLLSPYDAQFKPLKKYNDGHVRIHHLVSKKQKDWVDVSESAIVLAKKGNKVDIMPEINSEGIIRSIVFPELKNLKSPDLRVNGVLMDVKKVVTSPLETKHITRAMEYADKQCTSVFVILNEEVNISEAKAAVLGKLKKLKQLNKVVIKQNDGSIITILKQERQ